MIKLQKPGDLILKCVFCGKTADATSCFPITGWSLFEAPANDENLNGGVIRICRACMELVKGGEIKAPSADPPAPAPEDLTVHMLWGSSGAIVTEYAAKSVSELMAYLQGINDSDGWFESRSLDGEDLEFYLAMKPDCPVCSTVDPENFCQAKMLLEQYMCPGNALFISEDMKEAAKALKGDIVAVLGVENMRCDCCIDQQDILDIEDFRKGMNRP